MSAVAASRDFYRVVQRQQGYRRSQANTGCPLRRRSQHHERVGENREGAAEVNFPEPCDVEAESVPEFDLRHDVSVTLTLGKPARTRQLAKKPKRI